MNASLRAWLLFAAAAGIAVATRVHNAIHYPADWGFDAVFHWEYIFAVARRGELPPLEAGWATADAPLYFFLCGGLLRLGPGFAAWIPEVNLVLGLGIAAFAIALVRRIAPEDPARALFAGGAVLFVPAHLQMSAMVNEEMLAAFCTSAALFAIARPGAAARHGPAVAAGIAAGAAWLAKASGAIAIVAVGATLAARARRSDARRALSLAALSTAIAAAIGGLFWFRVIWASGAPLPSALPAHELMLTMPPGERTLADYFYFPLATFRDAQLLHPDLLRSVWGSLYASWWFDAHRYFLPTESEAVRRLGMWTTTLALVPSAAFALGLVRGARRAWRGSESDVALVVLSAASLIGIALYSAWNPWFAVLKGTSLLGLALPYACYTSEVWMDWSRRHRAIAFALAAVAAALVVCVTISGTFHGWFDRSEVPGLRWPGAPAP